ncbi:MAG: glycosyltransferase family 39 protein [Rhodospirillaceae bacterium]
MIALIMASLVLIRAGLFPGTGGDDGEQLIFSQYFDWGYQVRNPPLYTWLVIAVSNVTGANLWAVNIVKFILLAAVYLCLWRACLRIFQSTEVAAMAALSPVLFYYVAWETVTGFSHSVLAAAIYAGLFLVLVHLRDGGGHITDYVWFGALIGLGAISKYAFWIFAAALIAAALMDRDLRARLLSPKIVLSLAVACAIAFPHYQWLWARAGALGAQAGTTAAAGGLNAAGAWNALKAALGFLSPFWIIALALFPAAVIGMFRRGASGAAADPMARVIAWQLGLVLAGTLLGALMLPEFKVRTHYMFALILFPLWFWLRAEAMGISRRRMALFSMAIAVALFAGPVGMLAKYLFEPIVCNRCQHHLPYADLAARLRAEGFTGGTVIAVSHPDPLPGNLRAVLPEARVISVKHPDIIPPMRNGAGQCLSIWSADVDYQRRGDGIALANAKLNAAIPPKTPSKLISLPLVSPLPGGTDRIATFGMILLPASGDCR